LAIKIDCITSIDGLTPLREVWGALLAGNHLNQIFLSWEWQTTWWEAYHPGQLWVLVGRDEAGEVVGIAPCFLEAETQVVRGVGCIDVTDYLDFLAVPSQRLAFYDSLAAFFASQRGVFSRLNFCNIPADSPTHAELGARLAAHGFSTESLPQEVCPIIRLDMADFEAYVNKLDKKNRHELRRKMRRLEGEEVAVSWHIVDTNSDAANLDAALTQFTDLMAASTEAKAAFLQNPQHVAFFRAVMPKMAARGWLQLAFLQIGDQTTAAYLNFDYDNHILVYNSGLRPEPYGYLSPGIVLLAHLIEHAIAGGRQAFDFLRGNEEYKYRMGGVDRPVLELKAI
jgi:CelD/BcsL family acetyltransferase involved in cellulose biosynthesis